MLKIWNLANKAALRFEAWWTAFLSKPKFAGAVLTLLMWGWALWESVPLWGTAHIEPTATDIARTVWVATLFTFGLVGLFALFGVRQNEE